jgi:hypothetical protein
MKKQGRPWCIGKGFDHSAPINPITPAAQAGDGTTTSIVLSRALLREAQKYIISGVSPVEMKRGMDKAVESIVAKLAEIAIPISSEEDIQHGNSEIPSMLGRSSDNFHDNHQVPTGNKGSCQRLIGFRKEFHFRNKTNKDNKSCD